MKYASPLRYPGGKSTLTNYIRVLLKENDLLDGIYVEPFVGGAGVALSLLYNECVSKIIINDLNYSIYAFWYSVLYHSEELCSLIENVDLTVDEWLRQKEIQRSLNVTLLELGFSTFFLNRTNRSGIINGGIIGGLDQSGKWKIDVRFNKVELVKRIEKIVRYKDRITLYNLDAIDLIKNILPGLPSKTLVYLDPPYYKKGQDLYQNHFNHQDHENLASLIKNLKNILWLLTYDNIKPIHELYKEFRKIVYSMNYSAASKYSGSEVMIFSDRLKVPVVDNLIKVSL